MRPTDISQPRLSLRRPTLQDKAAVMKMLDSFQCPKHNIHGCNISDQLSYEEWLLANRQTERGINFPTGFVPAIQLVSFNSRGDAVGVLNLRLALNQTLRKVGGHIGYGIHPAFRRQGYGTYQLKLALDMARTLHMDKLLLTCHKNNLASQRVILANGGVYQDAYQETLHYEIIL